MEGSYIESDLAHILDLIHEKNPHSIREYLAKIIHVYGSSLNNYGLRLINNSYVTRHYLDLVPTHANANMTKLQVIDPFFLPFGKDTILPTEILL